MVASLIESSSLFQQDLPRLERRPWVEVTYQNALREGIAEPVARVIARRNVAGSSVHSFLNATLQQLTPESMLADIDIAAQRLATAIITQECIGIETDYDMDGIGAHATFVRALVDFWRHPKDRVLSFIGHRLIDGYGLSDAVADRIAASPATLVVTADNGSSDEPRIARLKAAGIDVIVTDHHHFNAAPDSAYAFINPQRPDCTYPDKAVAGGMVLWLLLRATERVLKDAGHLSRETPSLELLLDYVACSTVADCVSLASINNRAVVRAGLDAMNRMTRHCWEQFSRLLRCDEFSADSIAYGIAPRINARTRLSDPFAALHLLMANEHRRARDVAELLHAENEARKVIESQMIAEAVSEAAHLVQLGRRSICLLLPDGHSGVQGICSSRLVERFGRPTFLFSPSIGAADLVTGSARSGDRFHVQQALTEIHARAPGLIVKFGGHKAAAGATVRREDFERFARLFEDLACKQLTEEQVGPVVHSDGELAEEELTLDSVHALRVLEPTGRGFEPARFDGEFKVSNIRAIGDETHLSMDLTRGRVMLRGVWFRARQSPRAAMPITNGETARFVYSLVENEYRRRRSLELRVEARCAL
jgi:single-stranded-DNA-specific exonuclease